MSNAFTFGWTKFQQNLGPWLIATVTALIGWIVLFAIMAGILAALGKSGVSGATFTYDPGTLEAEVVDANVSLWYAITYAIVQAAMAFVGIVIVAQFIRAAIETVRTGKTDLAVFMRTDSLGTVIVAAIIIAGIFLVLGLIGIIPILGWIIAFVGSIVVGFFSQFFAYFALDQDTSAIDSIKSSFSFVNQNIATIVILYIASAIAMFIGAILCLVGLFVAVPVVVMAHAYTYRWLTGEGVAA